MEKIIKTSKYQIGFGKKVYKQIIKYFFKNNYKIFLVTDTNTKKYCIPYLKKNVPYLSKFQFIILYPGENSKQIYNCLYIWKKLIEEKADKNSIIFNFGGGVITDIGGFSASLFKRGIQFIHIPTTLLGMVDASIGGKTGLDLYHLKNEIGIFNNPQIILIDLKYLQTLPILEFKSGLSEMLKHGLIYDYNFWKRVKYYIDKNNVMKINFYKPIKCFKLNFIFLEKLIYKSVLIKINIVEKDPTEKGLRKLLNFGHTIGHWIESYFIDKSPYIRHGEALVLGIIFESWISYKIKKLSKEEFEEIFQFLSKNFNIKKIDYPLLGPLIKIMQHDKKNFSLKMNFSLLNQIGKCTYNKIVTLNLIQKSFSYNR